MENENIYVIDLKADFEKIKEATGIDFEAENLSAFGKFSSIYYYILNDLEFLATHNKNYNKDQYNRIIDLYEIIKNMEVL